MAEEFKEFVNKSVTSSDLNADNQTITLFTNDSNKQAIIRGVEIASDAKITKDKAKLFVGNQPVLNSFESATGSLFVDKGQSLTLKLNNPLTSQNVETLSLAHQGHEHGVANSYKYREYTYTVAATGQDFSPSGITPGLVAGTNYDDEVTGMDNLLGSSYHGSVFRNNNGNYWGYYQDTNSISRIVYSTNGSSFSEVDTTTYSGPAVNFESKKIYRKASSTLSYWDMNSTNTNATSADSNMHSTNTTYQTGAVIGPIDSAEYYFHNRSSTSHYGYVKKIGQSGATNPYFGSYNANLGSEPKIVVAYNSTESKIYMFTLRQDNWHNNSQVSLIVIPIGLINNLQNDNQIQGQAVGGTDATKYTIIHNSANAATVFGTAPFQHSRSRDMKHLGGAYVSIPISDTAVRIAKCENNGLTVVEDVNLSWLARTNNNGAADTSHLVGRAAVSQANYAVSDIDISSQLRVVGVELT